MSTEEPHAEDQSLFFADSDDEAAPEERSMQHSDVPITSSSPAPSSPESRVSGKDQALFLEDSDDEVILVDVESPAGTLQQDPVADSDVKMEFAELNKAMFEQPVAGSSRISQPEPQPARPTSTRNSEPPAKKRKLSADKGATSPGRSMYLGSFVVGNAWSTVRGKGYVRSGDEILIERDSRIVDPPKTKNTGKSTAKDAKPSKTGKKQLSIATMLKPQPAKPTKKKQDIVVRLANTRGFGARWSYSIVFWTRLTFAHDRVRKASTRRSFLGV